MGGLLRLIAGGVLAIPALLVTVVTAPIVALLSVPAAWCLLAHKEEQQQEAKKEELQSSSKNSTTKKQRRQVIVTGGSSGIGLAIAKCAVRDADDVARVVIVARNRERLQAASDEILAAAAAAPNATAVQVETRSVDVSDAAAVETAMSEIMKSSSNNNSQNIQTHLFLCAGEPHPAHFRDNTAADYARITNTNQLGSIYTAQAVLKHMTAGTVTFCSSICGQIGVFGYSAYSPSKFALRGYAECLSVELCNHPHIHVQVAYPPDTDTPGFAEENKRKPKETALISEMGGLADPRSIGQTMWREAIRKQPRFNVYFNLDGWLLCHETAGFAPVTTLSDCVAQVSLLNLARWIALFYLAEWHRLIRNYQNGRNKTAAGKEEKTATSHSSSSSSSAKED